MTDGIAFDNSCHASNFGLDGGILQRGDHVFVAWPDVSISADL